MGVSTLASLQNVDLILHIVREFEDENITHYRSAVDPLKDMNIVNKEILYYVRKDSVTLLKICPLNLLLTLRTVTF